MFPFWSLGPGIWNALSRLPHSDDPIVRALVGVTLIALAAHLALTLARSASAAIRHVISIAALAAMMMLPVAQGLLPAWSLPILPASLASIMPASPDPAMLADVPVQKSEPFVAPSTETTSDAWTEAEAPVMPPRPASGRWPEALGFAVLGVSLFLLARLAIAVLGALRLVHTSVPCADERLLDALARASSRLTLPASTRLALSPRVHVPLVVVMGAPCIVLPAEATEWSSERLDVVLLHELAHVRRGDALGLAIVNVATALAWFHPLVWTLARVARRECESACDDLVLHLGIRPSDYANHLLAIAGSKLNRPAPGEFVMALARRSTLESRVRDILRTNARRGPASRRVIAAIGAPLLLLAMTLATMSVVAAPSRMGKSPVAWTTKKTETRTRWAKSEKTESIPQYDGPAVIAPSAPEAPDAPEAPEPATAPEAWTEPTTPATPTTPMTSQPFEPFEKFKDESKHAEKGSKTFQLQKAEAELEVLKSEESTDPDAWRYVARELLRAGSPASAVTAFEHEIKLDPAPTEIYNLACALALSGNKPQSLAMLQRSVLAGYADPDNLRNDSDLQSLHGQPKFDEVVRLADDLSFSMMEESDTKKWRADLERYERVTREHPQLGRAWHNLAFARLRVGDARGSFEAWQRTLALGYRTGNTLYNLACTSAQLQDRDAAIAYLEQAKSAGFDLHDSIESDNDLDPLRGDARFKALVEREQREHASEEAAKKEEKKMKEKKEK